MSFFRVNRPESDIFSVGRAFVRADKQAGSCSDTKLDFFVFSGKDHGKKVNWTGSARLRWMIQIVSCSPGTAMASCRFGT